MGREDDMKSKQYILAAVALTVAAGVARAQPAELRFAHYLPATHPLSQSMAEWARGIEEAAGGTLKINIFPSEQLGKAFDGYDLARNGVADISLMSPGYTPGRFPIGEATALPFLIRTGDTGSRSVDEWYRQYAAKEMSETRYCMGFVHDPGTLHLTKKKVMVPADMKGLKIRPAGGTVGAFMFQLGATNVQASPPEAREVLERGVADGITFPWNSIIAFKISEVVKFHMDVPLYTSHQMLVMNSGSYNKLAPAAKKAIDDACTPAAALRVATPWAKWEAEGRAKIKAMAGHDVYALGSTELDEWKAAARQIGGKWAEGVTKAGGDPVKVMDSLVDILKRNNAAF
jgi:TRAP-type C4-dicarboxylate transport system substrate-binding protein